MRPDSIHAVKDGMQRAGEAIRDTAGMAAAHMNGKMTQGGPGGNHHPSVFSPVMMTGLIIFIITTFGFTYWAKKKPVYAKMLKRIRLLFQLASGTVVLTGITVTFLSREYVGFIINYSNQLVFVFLIILATIIIDSLVTIFVAKKLSNDAPDSHNKATTKYINQLISFVIYTIGIALALMVFPPVRSYGLNILKGAGVFAIVLSFVAKESFSNIISGLLILIFKPFRIGDIVKIGDSDDPEMVGNVYDITLRHTVIKNFKNKMIIIPNSVINSDKLVNFDTGQKETCAWVVIGISYDSDIDLAKNIMRDEILKHPSHIDIRKKEDIDAGKPEVVIRVIELADSSVVIRAWAWAADYQTSFAMKCDLNESIKKRFDKEGIEIPFPQQVIWLKNKDENIMVDVNSKHI